MRELPAWALGCRRIYRVRGASMEPLLFDGDFVLARASGKTRLDRIVVARDPDGRVVVKRVLSRGEGTVALGSDNPATARDSRHFGSIPESAVLGVVSYRLPDYLIRLIKRAAVSRTTLLL